MRSSRQLFYDRVYYGFERFLQVSVMNLRMCCKLFGKKTDKEFREAFKNSIRPYWAQFGVRPHKFWFKYYYQLTGSLDPRYIPDDVHFMNIVPHFDSNYYVRQLSDKNLHGLIFPHVKRPETIFKYADGCFCEDNFVPIPEQEALSRCVGQGSFIIKPTRDTGAGADIRFFDGFSTTEEFTEFLKPYKGLDYIVQRTVTQHPELARLNSSSVNTIRIITLVLHGETHILSTILRAGGPGSRVDNVSKGGYQCVIKPDGTLESLAYTHRDGKSTFVEQTDDGLRFADFTVPSWESVRQTAIKLATELPHLKFIGWDLAVDDKGEVVLIEFNCQIGQNQATCGPTFGDLTDDVLAAVFTKNKS